MIRKMLTTAAWTLACGLTTLATAGQPRLDRPADIRIVAQRAETIADSFEKRFDVALDGTIIDGTRREADAEKAMRKLEKSLDQVDKHAGRKKFKDVRKEVGKALEYAGIVDSYVRRVRLDRSITDEWFALVSQLDQLAYFYELPGIGRSYDPPTDRRDRRGPRRGYR